MLSDSEGSDTEPDFHKLTVNEHYAKAFEYKKEREELQKLKEKYGSDFESEDASEADSESDESEDEDGEELTPTVDAAILRTLARIKRKDPAIYDTNKNIFGEEQEKVTGTTKRTKVTKDKSKPITLRQVALESALNPNSRSPSPTPLPHVEEQRALRDETIAAFHNAVTEEDDEDNLLIPREKTQDQQEIEEEEYRAFLEREVGGDLRQLVMTPLSDDDTKVVGTDQSSVLKDETRKKKKKKNNALIVKSKQESDQEFLMSYILNRGWIDRSANHIPTYGEITSHSKGKQNGIGGTSTNNGEEDERALPSEDPDLNEDDFEEIVDRFESSYNFRFEEPGAATISIHPRNLPSLVRREDTRRKDARERRKQRKEEELQQKREEVKRLKGFKMKEIRSRLEKIGREGGKHLEDKALQELDLDGEWDPAVHDRQMAELYGDDDLDDEEMPHWDDYNFDDNEKPRWDNDIDIGYIPLNDDIPTPAIKKKKKKVYEGVEVDDGVDVDAMDADAEGYKDEEWDGTEEMRKRKLSEYMDEIYGLDFNDLVGGMQTRFKYVPVQPQNFALTPVEILMATDQELNEYMSVKKYAPYRTDVKWDSKRNDRLRELKQSIAGRMGRTVIDGFESSSNRGVGAVERPLKKRKGKKERLRLKASEGAASVDDVQQAATTRPDMSLKRKRGSEVGVLGVVEELGDSVKEVGKKKKRRHRQDLKDGGNVEVH